MEALRKLGIILDRINGGFEKIAVNLAWIMLLAITLLNIVHASIKANILGVCMYAC